MQNFGENTQVTANPKQEIEGMRATCSVLLCEKVDCPVALGRHFHEILHKVIAALIALWSCILHALEHDQAFSLPVLFLKTLQIRREMCPY